MRIKFSVELRDGVKINAVSTKKGTQEWTDKKVVEIKFSV